MTTIKRPRNKHYLPFQKEGIRFMLNRKNVLLADEMSLGKTVQAVGLWNSLPSVNTTLVICPIAPKLNWARHFDEWSCYECDVHVVSQEEGWREGADVYIIHYDILHKHEEEIKSIVWDLLLVDEAHYIKNPKAKRTKFIFGSRVQYPIRSKRRIFMTGTPVENRPIELWPIVRTLDPDGLGKSFLGFGYRYCFSPGKSYFGGVAARFRGARRTDELHRKMSSFMIRRKKSDVLQQLPPKRHQTIALEVNEAYQRMIRTEWQLYRKYKQACRWRRQSPEGQKTYLAKLTRLRKTLAMVKVPGTVDYVRGIVDQGGQVLCFAHHSDVVNKLREKFEQAGVGVIVGSTPAKKRDGIVSAFQAGDTKVLIAHLRVLIGLSITCTSRVVFAEIDWNPAVMRQAEDRCHRIGQSRDVQIDYIVLDGSLDDRLLRTMRKKERTSAEIVDGVLPTRSRT